MTQQFIADNTGAYKGSFDNDRAPAGTDYYDPSQSKWVALPSGWSKTLLPPPYANSTWSGSAWTGGSAPAGPSLSLSVNPPVSGTAYQNAASIAVNITIPITFNPTGISAASASVMRGGSNPPTVQGPQVSFPALASLAGTVQGISFNVPAGAWWSISVANATIGTATIGTAT